ncbi:MAG TPA: class I SAM-dependent methyltransferase, partial [Holophagaceae bacterium]
MPLPAEPRDWFVRDFDHPAYFDIYADKAEDAEVEGPALAALLDLPPGSRVLDLPCGWGRLQPFLAARGLRTVGGDLSPLNLHRHAQEHPGALVRLDLRALPFRAACVEGVFCAFTSWGYFATEAENRRQIEEFGRVLKPGGRLLLDLVGRERLLESTARAGDRWRDFPWLGYAERVRWTRDLRRIRTERRWQGQTFRHDIWIPEDEEVRDALSAAGFGPVTAF